MTTSFGPLNGDAVAVILKELVRRAITVISHQRFAHEAQGKTNELMPERDDFVTSADLAAQELYVECIRRCFPGFGIVAEEEHLAVPCTLYGTNIWVTIDPLDGTRAFMRRQSHGVGTMVSLVQDSEIVAAFVGDVFTREIYGYRPGADKVHRISEFEHRHQMGPLIDRVRPLRQQFLLLRDEPSKHSLAARALLGYGSARKRFGGFEITRGSIGISMARLWKGEVGAALIRPGAQTPWDLFPVYGISRKLGFRFLELGADGLTGREYVPEIVPRVQMLSTEALVVHESRLEEVGYWSDDGGIAMAP